MNAAKILKNGRIHLKDRKFTPKKEPAPKERTSLNVRHFCKFFSFK